MNTGVVAIAAKDEQWHSLSKAEVSKAETDGKGHKVPDSRGNLGGVQKNPVGEGQSQE